jgi:hypothetical protein
MDKCDARLAVPLVCVGRKCGHFIILYSLFISRIYFKFIFLLQSKEKMNRNQRRGCIRLRGAVYGIEDEDDSAFTITVDQKTFHMQGVCVCLCVYWVRVYVLTLS